MSDPIDLAARLPSPDRLALFLDIDGTLIGPSHGDRDRGIKAEQIGLLQELRALLANAVAVLTGRSIETADPLFVPHVLPMAGLQGCDRRFADGRRVLPVTTDAQRRAMEAVAEAIGPRYPHIEVEWKPGAMALVYVEGETDAPEAAEIARKLVAPHFNVILGRVAIDIVPPDASKGTALKAFMATAPFAGRVPVHFGDDVPDEVAFAAARELGGFGVTIGRAVTGIDRYLPHHNATWDTLAAYLARWKK
ncbi:trehalose-phosphatase [Oryzibacter oryziterrae]|uniref:trehalose-phosphatase n=1 Tax=Oryzibacter oryziterrae TaxID=2766474 RepID=UPI001F02132B|nr:trehalose-phosphatase [Oryzibacter oryziterrae]